MYLSKNLVVACFEEEVIVALANGQGREGALTTSTHGNWLGDYVNAKGETNNKIYGMNDTWRFDIISVCRREQRDRQNDCFSSYIQCFRSHLSHRYDAHFPEGFIGKTIHQIFVLRPACHRLENVCDQIHLHYIEDSDILIQNLQAQSIQYRFMYSLDKVLCRTIVPLP